MADKKLSQLTVNTAPLVTDRLALLDDPAGTPLTQTVAVSKLLELVYPVGSIYVSTVGTDPATLFGFGTWAAFGAGRVLVGYDSADSDFDTAEETGGAKTKAISAHTGCAVATHASHTHNYTQVPNHVHGLSTILRTSTSGSSTTQVTNSQDTSSTADTIRKTDNPDGGVETAVTAGPNSSLTHDVTQPSAHSDLNVMQPYVVVHFFKRTA